MAKNTKYEVRWTPRFVGITDASKKLGVSKQHLRWVLLGKRESPRILRECKRKYPGLLAVLERVK